MTINATEAHMSTSMSKHRIRLIFNLASKNKIAHAEAMPAIK